MLKSQHLYYDWDVIYFLGTGGGGKKKLKTFDFQWQTWVSYTILDGNLSAASKTLDVDEVHWKCGLYFPDRNLTPV